LVSSLIIFKIFAGISSTIASLRSTVFVVINVFSPIEIPLKIANSSQTQTISPIMTDENLLMGRLLAVEILNTSKVVFTILWSDIKLE